MCEEHISFFQTKSQCSMVDLEAEFPKDKIARVKWKLLINQTQIIHRKKAPTKCRKMTKNIMQI